MAFGRIRNNRRSSSSNSQVSTITIVVFIAFCVLGVWMLTSENNVVSPKATTRASTTTAPDEPNENTKPDESTTSNRSVTKVNSGSFEDDPGDLPDDALKPGESQRTQEDEKKSDQDRGKDLSKESTVGGSYPHNVESKVSKQENETRTDDNISKVDEADTKESNKAQEKQTEHQTQVSDENMLTEKQNIQQSFTNEQESNKKQQDQVGESRDGDRSGQRHEEATQKSDNQQEEQQQQQEQQEIEQEQKANVQQRAEDQEELEPQQQDINQQQTGEDQQRLQQGEKSITFSDATKKDPTKQETSKDSSTKQERDDTSKQEKPMVRQQEDEVAKQQDFEQENPGKVQVTKKDTGISTEPIIPNSEIPQEKNESKRSWSTQASHSNDEKQRQQENLKEKDEKSLYEYTWQLCNASADYIPCLDNEKAVKRLRTTKHFQHRERHCPEDPPTCLIPTPQGYKKPVHWPESRDKIWFHNVPHPELAKVKGHQNWVKVSGEFLTFPGGGTQFIHGALHYIDFLQKTVPRIKWGKHTRVVLDVGCGVASFGGYLFERDVLTMSFAPKDEHEAQVQFALERGIPAISAVMGSQRLPFPSRVFDAVHCARCRVPWHAEATPVYQKLKEDVDIWEAMLELTTSMCWRLEKKEKDKLNKIGAAIFRKPTNNQCYDQREENIPPMCRSDDDPDAAWYVPLEACMHHIPSDPLARGNKWPIRWPKRLTSPPYWLNNTQMGIYGKPALDDFERDYEHWQDVVKNSYLNELGINWSDVRNAMDMRAVYGGFAAALKNLEIWVMNVVNVNSPDTLPIIYERGLFGIYHDWCESFSTYPRTYDLLHADHLFSKLKERCKLIPVMAEVDRIVRPGGKLIVRDKTGIIGEVEQLLKSLHWEVHLTFSTNQVEILSATKSYWRPTNELS